MSHSVNRGRWELDRAKLGRGLEPPHLAVGAGGRGLTGGWVCCGTDIPQGNNDLALHSTNRTIQTTLMKCLGSCTLVNSNLFCFFSLHCCAEFCSLLIHLLLSTVSQFFSHC